jgi:hypothetical protein
MADYEHNQRRDDDDDDDDGDAYDENENEDEEEEEEEVGAASGWSFCYQKPDYYMLNCAWQWECCAENGSWTPYSISDARRLEQVRCTIYQNYTACCQAGIALFKKIYVGVSCGKSIYELHLTRHFFP